MEITIDDVRFAYGRREVLQGLSCRFRPGKLAAVLGVNGAGKSTLLKIIARLQTPGGGVVRLGGDPLAGLSARRLARRLGYVSQQHVVPRLTVFEYLLIGRLPYRRQRYLAVDEEIVTQVLTDMRLLDFADRWLMELSGGELQQVVIARALAQQPRILLLDEPTSNLDLKNQVALMTAVKNRSRCDDLTVVFSLHDVNLAARFADRFILLRDGRVLADGSRDVLEAEVLSQLYGLPLTVHRIEGQLLVAPTEPLPVGGPGNGGVSLKKHRVSPSDDGQAGDAE